MSFWNDAWDAITGAFSQIEGKEGWIGNAASWMENNKVATNLIGGTLLGVGNYFAQKEANKDLMRKEKELLNLKDQLQSKYSEVPEIDFTKYSLTVDDTPNLANGGILTEMKKRHEDKYKM